LPTPVSGSSTRGSFPGEAVPRNNTYCSLKRFGGANDEGEAAFLEVRHRSEAAGGAASSAETMWIERDFDAGNGHKDSARKKRHFIYSTMSRITMCRGLNKSKSGPEVEARRDKRLKLRSGILLSDRKSGKKFRRADSEEESDYAYIDRSTHSITGYLNMEAKNVQVRDAMVAAIFSSICIHFQQIFSSMFCNFRPTLDVNCICYITSFFSSKT
jgi:hypothetical protein